MSTAERARVDFIVGMARSGTTWLAQTLAEHPDVAVFGETSFFGRLHLPPRADGTYGEDELKRVLAIQREQEWSKTTGDDAGCLRRTRPEEYATLVDSAFAGLRAPTTPAEVFEQLVRAVAQSEGRSRVLEKTPHHVHWLPRVAAAFPHAKFVVVRRDPYSFIASLLHLGDRLGGRWQRALDRPWRHPLLAALAWRGYMLSIERALQRYPERIVVVETHELRGMPDDVLERVQSFLELDVLELPTHSEGANSSFRVGPPARPGAADIWWTNLVAGRVMRRNGYELQRVPFRPLSVLSSFLTLPISLAWVGVALPQKVPGSFRAYLAHWLGRG